MRKPLAYKLLLTYLCSLIFTLSASAQFIIDDFDNEHITPGMSSSFSTDSEVLGGEREVDNANNSFSTSNEDSELVTTLDFFNSVRLIYDGDDTDPGVIDYEGLGGLDLASTSDALLINDVQSLQSSVVIDIALHTSDGNSSFARRELSSFSEPVDLVVPFSEFEVLNGDGADFSRIGAIEIVVTGNGETLFLVDSFSFNDTPLPVELTSFTAILNQNAAILSWVTASELNNAGFWVEHLAPHSESFISVAYVEGHGSTDIKQSYNYTVYGLISGIHHFRLKQIDFDGTFEYSPIVEIETHVDAPYDMSAAYPNPFNPKSTFLLTVQRDQQVNITLHDILGQEVDVLYSGTLQAQSERQFVIDGTRLSSGMYFYQVIGEYFRASGQVFVLK